ncbi:tetratricopeptide repeat protein [Pelomyxa schiedti]|nr:tetratricopeptide repeat protein [Pelomyxa schiedti]
MGNTQERFTSLTPEILLPKSPSPPAVVPSSSVGCTSDSYVEHGKSEVEGGSAKQVGSDDHETEVEQLNRRAREQHRRGRYAEAVALYDMAIKSGGGSDPAALFYRAIALSEMGALTRALESIDESLAMSPPTADVLRKKGDILRRLGQHDKAIEAFDAAIAIDPNEPVVLSNKGCALNKLGRYEDALVAFTAALTINPTSPQFLNNKGALHINKNDVAALHNKGVALQRIGEHMEAVEVLDEALEVITASSSNGLVSEENALTLSDILNCRGMSLCALAQLQDALESFNASLQLIHAGQSQARTLNNKGMVLVLLGQCGAALPVFDLASQAWPEFADPLNNKGIALAQLGRIEEARSAFDAALALCPKYAAAAENRASMEQDEHTTGSWLSEAVSSTKPALWSMVGSTMSLLPKFGKKNEDKFQINS